MSRTKRFTAEDVATILLDSDKEFENIVGAGGIDLDEDDEFFPIPEDDEDESMSELSESLCSECERTDQEEDENKSDENFVRESSEVRKKAFKQLKMNKQANHVVQNPRISQR